MHDPLTRLGPYELVRRLPRPGRAEVYLGRRVVHVRPGAATADWPDPATVKVLRPPDDPGAAAEPRVKEALARFVEEGRLGMRLRHPAVTRTYGVGLDRDQNLHFIVQEALDGATLAQVLTYQAEKAEPLPYRVVLQLVIPLLRALHHAYHDALREDGRPLRVVHRDIKPANVLLTWRGRVVLLDFSAARSTSFTRQETVQDVLVGTAHYLAPEQLFQPEAVGHATDIFAVSVILYELATLSPLLPRTRRFSEVAAALSRFDLAGCIGRIDQGRYPGLAEVLGQGLSPDPATRFLTAGEMARELERLLLGVDTGPGVSDLAGALRRKFVPEGLEVVQAAVAGGSRNGSPSGGHPDERSQDGVAARREAGGGAAGSPGESTQRGAAPLSDRASRQTPGAGVHAGTGTAIERTVERGGRLSSRVLVSVVVVGFFLALVGIFLLAR